MVKVARDSGPVKKVERSPQEKADRQAKRGKSKSATVTAPMPQVKDRPVIYDQPKVRLSIGAKAITVKEAKGILGWTEETKDVKFGDTYLLKDDRGRKIRCLNNVTNRPIYRGVIENLKQDLLRRRWRFNGEPIILGKTGLVLNGQHTCLALISASEEWRVHRETWGDNWPEEPTLDKLIVFGVEETDEVVNTMDTCKPRSLADVLYRSEYFKKLKDKDRRVASRMMDNAIRLLWHRSGIDLLAFAPRRTHAEFLAFLNNHPKLVDCVSHIFEEEGGEGRISRYLAPGYAAGLLYLMAASKSDGEAYGRSETPSEKLLDLSRWSKACDFFVCLAGGAKEVAAVKPAITIALDTGLGGTKEERWAIIVKAWLRYSADKPITDKDLSLEYCFFGSTPDSGRKLAETPCAGGIDLGNPKEASHTDPSPEQIEREATRARGKKAAKKVSKTREKKAVRRRSPEPIKHKAAVKKPEKAVPSVGEILWATADSQEPFRGKLLRVAEGVGFLRINQGFSGAGTTVSVPLNRLQTESPIKPQAPVIEEEEE